MSVPHSVLNPISRMKLNNIELSERAANVDFKDAVLAQVGDLDGYSVLGTNILVATYIKPRLTAGGIIMTDKSVDEDRWQGKVGLVLKMGDEAFKYTYTAGGAYENVGSKPEVGQYISFHTSDAREIGIRGVSCKIIDASLIRMVVPRPDDIY